MPIMIELTAVNQRVGTAQVEAMVLIAAARRPTGRARVMEPDADQLIPARAAPADLRALVVRIANIRIEEANVMGPELDVQPGILPMRVHGEPVEDEIADAPRGGREALKAEAVHGHGLPLVGEEANGGLPGGPRREMRLLSPHLVPIVSSTDIDGIARLQHAECAGDRLKRRRDATARVAIAACGGHIVGGGVHG